jgi:hypothetical protein
VSEDEEEDEEEHGESTSNSQNANHSGMYSTAARSVFNAVTVENIAFTLVFSHHSLFRWSITQSAKEQRAYKENCQCL